MLKSSKLPHKSHKSSKDSSLRKSHLSKKTLRSRSPVRVSGSSRPTSMKHISSGMKQGHLIPKRKSSHSPRLRSIASSPHRSLSHRSKPESPVSIDRARSMKGLKYEKRKPMSNSPVRHMGSSSSRRPISSQEEHSMPPYEIERYQSSGPVLHSSQYSSPPRKKNRRSGLDKDDSSLFPNGREAERYFTSRSTSVSPPRRHPVSSLHSESHISPRHESSPSPVHHRHRRNIPVSHGEREKHNFDVRIKHHESSPPDMPSSRLKETVKVPYSSENSRYRSASPGNRYTSVGSKSYGGPTLHERFSSVITSNRNEPRIHYSREELAKITIDIKRNLRNSSASMRHIDNPSEIKLVRRANEGHRPIFDRDELKQTPRDMRGEAYYERKTSVLYNSSHPIDLREVENYQITRHRFDNHDIMAGSTRSLNDRFPSHNGRKDAVILDRDEREKEYQRIPVSRGYISSRSRSRSGDRDFRSERYLDVKPSSNSRSEYQRLPVDPPEPRSSIPYSHRKSSMPIDARHKLNVKKSDRETHSSLRSDSKSHYVPESRHYSDLPPPRVERREHHSPLPEPHKWDYKSRSPSRDKFPDISRRFEKLNYKSWADKPDISPKSSDYFGEPREASSSYTSRGGSRPFRTSRGFRTRGFRGPMRGSTYYRGSFRGYRSSSSPRGRGIPRR